MGGIAQVPLNLTTDSLVHEKPDGEPEEGMALCLSGGGYRAMIFHVGVFWRLNDAGWLPKLKRISSVSGGSITSAMLGLKWAQLAFKADGVSDAFEHLVVSPLRKLGAKTIDVKSVLSGLLWFGTIGDKIASAYRDSLFGHSTLQDLPDQPRFVINATSVQTGSLWRFSKPYMGDYQVGLINNPRTELAVAVGASSAFPPVLSPVVIDLTKETFDSVSKGPLCKPAYSTRLVLNDGGVYDNLGLESIWKRYKTVLVSDAGGRMETEEAPSEDWVRHSKRVLDLVDNQVRNLRKRQVIDSLKSGVRLGAYWGIRTNIQDYSLSDAFPCPFEQTMALASIPTRLAAMSDDTQERLINWGYAVCDAALRRHVDKSLARPPRLPYPSRAV